MNLTERFLQYVAQDTQADDATHVTPSTIGQMLFAQKLQAELERIGMTEITLDENGYLMASLASNVDHEVPTIGFIAHMDTAPDFSGRDVSPRIVANYDGGDIVLNEQERIIMSPVNFPELKKYIGNDLIVTNGLTLLGADDKAGIAEIVSAMEYLIANPTLKHGKIRVAFTPDEEIGLGAHKFDVPAFGAEWAYTIDGGEVGELEFENFNAAAATITFKGRNVHPGYAKNKMVNSLQVAHQFVSMLPKWEAPEHTAGYEGFYHLVDFKGTVEESTVVYIVRDHDRACFDRRKRELEHLVTKINKEFPNCATIVLKDQYFNMREKVEPVKHIVDIAFKAMEEIGIVPKVKPIRGGTDGSQLSYKGLPCPNIFTGGHNFHGRFEFIPVQSMEKAMKTIIRLTELVALSAK